MRMSVVLFLFVCCPRCGKLAIAFFTFNLLFSVEDTVLIQLLVFFASLFSFLGKGMIKVKPPTVWQAVKNHTTRHVFDKMLKVKYS